MKFIAAITTALLFIISACATNSTDRNPDSIKETSSAELIYNLLNVEEKSGHDENSNGLPPAIGARVTNKSVGGLKCEKVTSTAPNAIPQYSCSVNTPLNAEQIYTALNVEEAPQGANTVAKVAGDLVCKRMNPSKSNSKIRYICSITI